MAVDSTPSNPDENKLGANVNEDALLDAIEQSGYPLQGQAAHILESEFAVTEEWGFLQGEDHRSLDLYCWRQLKRASSHFYSGLVLLGECKRSSLPYVFFKDVTERPISGFPSVASFKSTVEIYESCGNRYKSFDLRNAFDIQAQPFLADGPPRCSSFSKAEPKGSGGFRFSGNDPFNRVVLPLIRALDHAETVFRPQGNRDRLELVLLAPVAILDAPMLVIANPEKPREAMLTPWIPVARHEARPETWNPRGWYGIDFVHVGFLKEYVSKHLLPFARAFVSAYHSNVHIVQNGGLVEDVEAFQWVEVVPRPRNAR